MESSLYTLTATTFPGLVSSPSVKCPCLASKACSHHKTKNCPDPNCLHLLPLHQCLSQTTVWCQYFRVETSFIRNYFPGEGPDLMDLAGQDVGRERRWVMMMIIMTMMMTVTKLLPITMMMMMTVTKLMTVMMI